MEKLQPDQALIATFLISNTDRWKKLTEYPLTLSSFLRYFTILPIPTSITTGWPTSKFEMSFGCNSETVHFWPYVCKAKMRLRGVQFFWKIVNKQLRIKEIVRLSNAFWLYQYGVWSAYSQSYGPYKRAILIWVTK